MPPLHADALFPGVAPGESKAGIRCENLERQTFADGSFDLVVTSDVFEHVLDPARAFAEIARTLRPEERTFSQLPWYWWKETLIRAVRTEDGKIKSLEPPDYHGNPIDESGSLVVTEWGRQLCDFIYSLLRYDDYGHFDPRHETRSRRRVLRGIYQRQGKSATSA